MTIGMKIAAMRSKAGLTQEELADILHISRQAVQKWETDMSKPDIERLVSICGFFHITVDELVGNKKMNITDEELRFNRQFLPNYASMPGWELYSSNIKTEYLQMADEGWDVEPYKKLVNEISLLPPGKAREDMADIVAGLMHTKKRDGYAFNEPSDLDGIRRLCQGNGSGFHVPDDLAVLKEKIRGAWQGRISGCLLGKPVEGIKTEELIMILKETGNYPMRRYIVKQEISDDLGAKCVFPIKDRCYGSSLSAAPADDDTNYTIMAAARLIDTYGRNFQPVDVAKCWLSSQPKEAYCTAERVAYVNFVKGYCPPVSAIYKNPFREWIGAQIRGDYYGYICPGNPGEASDMAWRDASISHVKNGIYGEMFVAAMLSCAAVCNDVNEIIKVGLSEIPTSSRLYSEAGKIIAMFENKESAESCMEWIHHNYDECNSHGWCHTIPNALIVLVSLLYGDLDFGKSVGMAVQAGFDTDCNGATVGSIVGMIIGSSGIPEQWTSAFHDKIETTIFGVGTVSIDELVALTMSHIQMGA